MNSTQMVTWAMEDCGVSAREAASAFQRASEALQKVLEDEVYCLATREALRQRWEGMSPHRKIGWWMTWFIEGDDWWPAQEWLLHHGKPEEAPWYLFGKAHFA